MKPPNAVRLHVEPISSGMANDYINSVHRHHDAVEWGGVFMRLGALTEDGEIRGVVTLSIPVAANRLTDGSRTVEVTRLATDGTPNACSLLYAACARIAHAAGFSRILTYVLDTETGVSLTASGWTRDEGNFGNLTWTNRPGRSGKNFGPKHRWSKTFTRLDRPAQRLPDTVSLSTPTKPRLPGLERI